MKTDNCENCQKHIHPQMEGIPMSDSSFICMEIKGQYSGFHFVCFFYCLLIFLFLRILWSNVLLILQPDAGSPLTFPNRTHLLGIAITDHGYYGCHFVRISYHYEWIKEQMSKIIY